MKRNQIVTLAAIVVIVAAGGGILLYRGRGDSLVPAAQAQSSSPPVAVQTAQPARRDVSRLISLPGDVHPWEEATLYAKVPGYLQSISVDKGDRVKAGQVLAVIQAPELQADRDQARQTYQSALAAAQGSRASGERAAAEMRRAQAAAEKAQADYDQAPAAVARAKAQLQQMQGALQQAQEQKQQAQAALKESQEQVEKAHADLDAARADQRLADLTYERYLGIYNKNAMLIAKQDVDVVESKAQSARGKTAAAQSAVSAAQDHVQVSQAQVLAADSQIQQAQAQVAAAREQVHLTAAQQTSLQKQLDVAERDLAVSRKQQAVAQACAQQSLFQANAGRSAFGKSSDVADYARIHAPFSGVVTKRFVDIGAFIQTASATQSAAPIVTVADLSVVRVYIAVPEVEARFLRVGTPVTLTTTSLPDQMITGRVARTTGSLDPKTRTLLAEVDLPNQEGLILPGAYATAKVVLETHPHVLSVPTAAVGAEKAGKFVFVDDHGRVRRVGVTTGFDDGIYTEITSGLQEKEQVIVTGRDALIPNASVNASPWKPMKRE